MSIRILENTEWERGERAVTLVEVLDPETDQRSVGWQFVCELCDEFRTGLTEEEAQDAFANHACRVLDEY